MPDPIAAISARARDQHSHVTTAQAVADGVSRKALHRLARAGVLVRVHHGVYRLASARVAWQGRLMAAVLAAGDGAVASHAWAAHLHGITRVDMGTEPEITVPGHRTLAIPGVRIHRSRDLPSCDTTVKQGIPATSGARTSIDLASRLPEEEIMTVTDEMICSRATTRKWQHRRAVALHRGRPGVHVIVRITRPGAEDEFWSWLERRFDTGVVRAHGLPVPAYNVPLSDNRGFIGYADACWERALTVVVEVDGLRFHRLISTRRKDARKSNRHALAGRIPLRFVYTDVVQNPACVAAEILRALDRANRAAS